MTPHDELAAVLRALEVTRASIAGAVGRPAQARALHAVGPHLSALIKAARKLVDRDDETSYAATLRDEARCDELAGMASGYPDRSARLVAHAEYDWPADVLDALADQEASLLAAIDTIADAVAAMLADRRRTPEGAGACGAV